MLVTAIYNATDTFFVGRISTEATAAVGLSFSIMAIIQAMGFFCGQGSGNYLSRMLGAGKQQEAEEMAATGLSLAVILGVTTMLLCLVFIEPLTEFLGATAAIKKETVEYLQGGATLDETISRVAQATRNFAKRQLTWYRRMEYIQWLKI